VSEFTGERVIPGQVNDDLWAEHVARYAFAARFAAGERILDAGCGTGYGACELARAGGFVTAIDSDYEAVKYAAEQGIGDSRTALQATVTAMPFRDACFDLITAFEVIEHLEDWRGLLREARRVLDNHGMFLVSTPNKVYYAETRALEGPNPYHVHEFEFEEFRAALCEYFPHVQILFQNRMESFGFHAGEITGPIEIRVDKAAGAAEDAHFFVGVCGIEPLAELQTFLYVPRAANVLREREQHIRKLEQELAQTKKWLDEQIADHVTLQREHEQLNEHVAEKNRWARELEANWKAAQGRIIELQNEFEAQQTAAQAMAAGYERQVAELDEENRKKTQWAMETEARLTADLAERARQLAATVELLDRAEATVIERTEWAQRLDAELNQVKAILNMVQDSRWIRMGRAIGLGPKL